MMSLTRGNFLRRVLNTAQNQHRSLTQTCIQKQVDQPEKPKKKAEHFQINVKDLVDEDRLATEEIAKPLTKMTFDDHVKIVKEERSRRHRGKLETKELNMMEKFILVRIGRFQRLDEVPDKIKYSSQEEMDRDKEITMTLLKENGFKMFTGLNYLLWVFTFIFGGALFYTHYRKQKVERKQLEEDQDIFTASDES